MAMHRYTQFGGGYMLALWIIVIFLAALIDALTSNLFFICFAVGGLTAIVMNLLGLPPMVQTITFCIISILFLVLAIPVARRWLKNSVPKTLPAEHKYIGRVIVMEQDIQDEAMVSIDSIYWTVKNNGADILKGQKAIIVDFEGNKLVIQKHEE